MILTYRLYIISPFTLYKTPTAATRIACYRLSVRPLYKARTSHIFESSGSIQNRLCIERESILGIPIEIKVEKKYIDKKLKKKDSFFLREFQFFTNLPCIMHRRMIGLHGVYQRSLKLLFNLTGGHAALATTADNNQRRSSATDRGDWAYLDWTDRHSLSIRYVFHIQLFTIFSPVKTRGYRVELVRLSVRPSVCPSVRLSVPLDKGYFVHASLV